MTRNTDHSTSFDAPEPEQSNVATTDELDSRLPEHSDDALALRFAARYRDCLRHVLLWGKWLVLEPTRWREDEVGLPLKLARTICRNAARECDTPKAAKPVVAIRTITAVEKLARVDERHAATIDQWDRDLWALNTPGGIIDLRTGKMRSMRPDDYVTKCSAISPAGDCKLWNRFLDQITAGDQELQSFLQRVAGYCLTGLTSEHALFFAYGTGANGKGVFLNTVSSILRDYAAIAPMDTFTATYGDRHPTDLAMLRGARLVVAQETEQAKDWAEAKVKALTGGDPITARFVRQDFFTYKPQFKLLIAGNHKPVLHSVDEAIRRRFHFIPFAVTIPSSERNPNLTNDLKVEWPGILKWAINGCLEWQAIGLAPPDAVQAATDEYLSGEDTLAQWMAECCDRAGQGAPAHAEALTSDLFASWSGWAMRAGETARTMKAFSQEMTKRGFILGRGGERGKLSCIKGLRLRLHQDIEQ